jgi:GntR family transcriptional regulator
VAKEHANMSEPPVSAYIDVRSFEPYYLQLKRILVADIRAERVEGDLLPSESQLCQRYGVSRTVVRQALAELENEGLVLKVKGSGTFVTGRKLETGFIQHSLGFYESMRTAGHEVKSKVLVFRTEPCGVEIAQQLELAVGTEIVRFDRVRSVDGRAVQVVRTSSPSRLLPGIMEIDMTDRSFYEVIRDLYGIVPASGRRTIEATELSSAEASQLGAPKGVPALRLESVTRDSRGMLFEHYVAVYRGDSFKFELEVVGAAHDLQMTRNAVRRGSPGAARARAGLRA